MLARAVTHALVGLEPRRVDVEAHVRDGIPGFAIVGLADRACQEARERVRSGITAAELKFPDGRITVNLAPAELRKEGSGFDLPIALAVLARVAAAAAGARSTRTAAVGELALDGRLRRVGGVLAVAEGARRLGVERLLCPADRRGGRARRRRRVPSGTSPRRSRYLRGETELEPEPAPRDRRRGAGARPRRRARAGACAPRARARRGGRPQPPARRPAGDGQDDARAAAAGHPAAARPRRRARGDPHPLGRRARSPASGRSSRRRRSARRTTARRRPRSSAAARISGPGEASLAHRGVLLLDELAEFRRDALEALRQPLEDGFVAVARAAGRVVFPARFQLVGTMNLCPCGGRGDPGAQCSCSAQRLARYRDKLSRALLDRFDLVVAMPRVRGGRACGRARRGVGAGARARRRGAGAARRRAAEARPPRRASCSANAVDRLHLSGRGHARVGRVARTIAALAGAETVRAEHVAEALAYRSPDELRDV